MYGIIQRFLKMFFKQKLDIFHGINQSYGKKNVLSHLLWE